MIEGAMEMAYPGRLALMESAQATLSASEEVVAVLGSNIEIGDADTKESVVVDGAGEYLQCSVSGSAGSGIVWIGGAKDPDDGSMKLEMIRLQVGDADFEVEVD